MAECDEFLRFRNMVIHGCIKCNRHPLNAHAQNCNDNHREDIRQFKTVFKVKNFKYKN